MRRFIISLLVLFVSIIIGIKIAQDPGYLLLAYKKWTVEMPLWFAILLFGVLFFILYYLLRVWRGIRNFPVRWQSRVKRRHLKKLDKLSQQAFLALVAGDWSMAQRKLSKASAYTQLSWLYNLAAAFSAHEEKNYEKRDLYLQKVSETSSEASIAVNLLRAKFDADKEPNKAVAVLENIRQKVPRQPYTLRLLALSYERLKDWNNLLELLPALRRAGVFTPEEYDRLEVSLYRGLLHSAEYNNITGLQTVWRSASRHSKQNPELVKSYVRLLLAKGATKEAEEQLRESLKHLWNSDLVELYGFILSSKPDLQLSYAEKWLPDHKNDAMLLYVLGHLSVRNQLWGKARSYFEASLAIDPKPRTYLELGQLLEQLGENNSKIIECLKTGLRLKQQPLDA